MPDNTRAAIYARISQDDLGTARGVARQLEDARALATAHGWEVVAEFSDNDVSAYNGAHRPGYEGLMAAAEAGAFDRIVCYQTSRLWRSRSERGPMIDRLGRARVSVTAVKGPELDLTSAYGRGVAGMMGEFDTMESEIKGERVARAALERAKEGRANGPVLYGWRREYEHDERGQVTSFRDVEDPETADVVREIVQRIADGDALRAIADDLNARDIPAPSRRPGVIWRHSAVRKIALRPANIGKRVHQGKIIGDAAWPAIIDEDLHHRAALALEAKSKGAAVNPFPPQERRWLLTYGVGECGVCGSVLRVAFKGNSKRGRKHHLYVCEAAGCTGRRVDFVDELVGAVVVERLARPDAVGLLDPVQDPSAPSRAHTRVEELRARLTAAAERYADGDITGEQMAIITEKLRPEIEQAERDLRRLEAAAGTPVSSEDLDDLRDPERAAAVWDGLDVDRRRAVLETLGLRVIIDRQRPGPGFDPTALRFIWPEPTKVAHTPARGVRDARPVLGV